MKDFEKVTDFGNLYKAYKKAKSGRGHKRSSDKFDVMALEGIQRIKELLETHEYRLSEYNEFYVYEPKKRLIKSGSFVDKIVGHSLCDNVLIPIFENVLIDKNVAGRKGKGTSFGLDAAIQDMQNFYDQHGYDGYILKADITKYYYSINHDMLKKLVRRYIKDQDVLWLCDLIIDSTENPGLPLGNQTSQVFGLLYLNELDHAFTENFGILYYGRYSDDIYAFHESKEHLGYSLDEATRITERYGLTFNGKTQIMPFKQGLKYLGVHIYIVDGKAVCTLKNENRRNAYKRYLKQAMLVKKGELDIEKFYERLNSYLEHAVKHGGESVALDLYTKVQEILEGK